MLVGRREALGFLELRLSPGASVREALRFMTRARRASAEL